MLRTIFEAFEEKRMYVVKGLDRTTGEPRTIEVYAASKETAQILANKADLLVETIEEGTIIDYATTKASVESLSPQPNETPSETYLRTIAWHVRTWSIVWLVLILLSILAIGVALGH